MLLAVLGSGCAKKSPSETSPPESQGDDLAALEQQLAQREGELQAIGISPRARVNQTSARDGEAADAAGSPPEAMDQPSPSTAPVQPEAQQMKSAEPQRDRCEQVCEISAAICTLEEQICGLLPRHRGDARYQDACDRSVADCQVATEACHACTAN